MNSSRYLLSLILIIAATSSHCHSSDNKLDDVETPHNRVDIGPFRIETYVNETSQREKLKLRKSYIKLKILDKQHPDVTYGSIKFSEREELMLCDKLILESAEHLNSLDCQPLESFFFNNETKKDGIKFVRRSLIRFKPRLPKFLPQVQQEFRVFPIVEEEVEESIKGVYENFNLTGPDFVEKNLKLGYYYEYYLKQERDQVDPFVCTGKIFMSINQTDVSPPISDIYDYLLDKAWEDGYLLTFEDVSCGYGSFFILSGSFTIIQRVRFPYLIVLHTMKASPSFIFNYNAYVHQTLVPEKGPSAYNTSVRIKSTSGLIDWLNFKLDQVFANEDLENGMEKMSLITSAGYGLVDSHWDSGQLVKMFRWFAYNSKDVLSLGQGFLEKIPELLRLTFMNSEADDYLQLALKLKKDIINPIMETIDLTTETVNPTMDQVKDEL